MIKYHRKLYFPPRKNSTPCSKIELFCWIEGFDSKRKKDELHLSMIWISGIQNFNEIVKDKGNADDVFFKLMTHYEGNKNSDWTDRRRDVTQVSYKILKKIFYGIQKFRKIDKFTFGDIEGRLLEFQCPEWIKFIYQGFPKVIKVDLVEASVDDFIARWKA